MTDQPPEEEPDADEASEQQDDRIPDESTLMGKGGVEEEVLAELARAEGKMNDPDETEDDPDARGAQV